ncbi:MAG TPA: RNA 2',3'-cyclic phosphodiesterase [Anaerolineae bacterium]|nr:RNA 2',3'-cyclic phosphodiesterase [Anaerolineae bacterium]
MNRELRVFVAAELNDTVRAELKRAQQRLRQESAAQVVRWVAPQNIHLTFKFLGNTAESKIPLLKEALARAATGSARFILTVRGLGCFPNARRPNNIWVGLEGDIARAALLAQRIEEECAMRGFPRDERGFTPHLTLGRVRREASNHERAALGELVKNFPPTTVGTLHVDALYLIQSNLQPSGPIYTVLDKAMLTSNQDLRGFSRRNHRTNLKGLEDS